jgi:hypothetical protein
MNTVFSFIKNSIKVTPPPRSAGLISDTPYIAYITAFPRNRPGTWKKKTPAAADNLKTITNEPKGIPNDLTGSLMTHREPSTTRRGAQ